MPGACESAALPAARPAAPARHGQTQSAALGRLAGPGIRVAAGCQVDDWLLVTQ